MARVWAYREGAFRGTEGGWTHVVNFNYAHNLVDQLTALNLLGQVEHLAILAHGNIPGQVLMNEPWGPGPPGPTPIGASTFGRLYAPFMRPNSLVILTACVAGGGDRGSRFLSEISISIPQSVIVGYSIWGMFSDSFGSYSVPGNVQAAPGQRPIAGARLTPWSPWAKWARRGAIVRLPADEQEQMSGRRCANPNCPGHESSPPNGRTPTLGHCPYGRWGSDSFLAQLDREQPPEPDQVRGQQAIDPAPRPGASVR